MLLINCQIHLELNWRENCVMSSIDGATTFKIKNTKLYVPIVTLTNKDNIRLIKQLSENLIGLCIGMNQKKKQEKHTITRSYKILS